MVAHLGPLKTISYLRENVWWKDLNSNIEDFCWSCSVCQTTKPTNHAAYGLLETLQVPTYLWETIGIDFVGPLPKSKTISGTFNMIIVIIDHLTSMVHLVLTKQTYHARDIAEIMFDRVYRLHGMPANIISDWDSLFTSTFWKKINELTGTELRMLSAFHPQTDSATECANQTIIQMLWQYVLPNQRDWASKIPAIKFTLNTARSETTDFAPFFLNYSHLPRSIIWNSDSEYPGVRIFAQWMKDTIMWAHNTIISARVKQTQVANRKCKEAPFAKEDLVYLLMSHIILPKGRARKLAPKFIRLFKILEDYRNNSFHLDLPSELRQRGMHPMFHATLLQIHIPNNDRWFPGRQIPQIIGIGRFKDLSVDKILQHHRKGQDSLFELQHTTSDMIWLLHYEVSSLEALNQYLEAQNIKNVNELPKQISHVEKSFLFMINPQQHEHYRDTMMFIDWLPQLLGEMDTHILPSIPDQNPAQGIKDKDQRPSQHTGEPPMDWPDQWHTIPHSIFHNFVPLPSSSMTEHLIWSMTPHHQAISGSATKIAATPTTIYATHSHPCTLVAPTMIITESPLGMEDTMVTQPQIPFLNDSRQTLPKVDITMGALHMPELTIHQKTCSPDENASTKYLNGLTTVPVTTGISAVTSHIPPAIITTTSTTSCSSILPSIPLSPNHLCSCL